jgi:hypothetical protein
MNDEPTKRPGKRGNPRVFARVPPDIYAGITAMRREYHTVDGKDAKITDIVLAFLVDGAPLLDRALRERWRALATSRGEAMATTLREVMLAGMGALGAKK